MAEVRGLEVILGIGVCAAAILVRLAVSLHPYSGAGQPVMYGDYEAQRHWMEITYNLPMKEWYMNTTSNDLQYWGLDYPPLTAYHSWLCGALAHYLNPDWVALHQSRGYESYEHKLFMRYSVLAMDVLIYFTAAIVYCQLLYRERWSTWERSSLLLLLLLQPALVLIDHGHFQFNCISLGLAFWAVIAVTTNHDIIGSVLFSLALNYKQMELYHALPFFCYLLGKALCDNPNGQWLRKVAYLGVTVVGTFVLCWLPFLDSWTHMWQVLHRLFPLSRGLYEDKVANVWCSLSLLLKMKKLFSVVALVRITFVMTIVAMIPSSWNLLRNPTPYRFVLALVSSSLIFFLFSFQVHEKSILLTTLPASLLTHHHPHIITWFQLLAVFSMYPLATKDGLSLACWALSGLFCLCSLVFSPAQSTPRPVRTILISSLCSLLLLCVLSHLIPPPPHLPDLFPVLISSLSCLLLLLFLLYCHWLQFSATSSHSVAVVTATMAPTKPPVYENTGRPIILTYPLNEKKSKVE